ncbi:intraflagellar transport protein 57 homolog [Hippocampus comes]|uniref:intraflagellar transport protein 57 homolog n=1 Tax=Hippocampus comes TaxID=109280 RepID=UPI00094E5CE8|nr:PREDICTED: intraflagellar transport protein 57 homolog [Hippocampus comes]
MTSPRCGGAPLHRDDNRSVNIATRRRLTASLTEMTGLFSSLRSTSAKRIHCAPGAHMAHHRRGDEDDRGPGAAYQAFVAMERLLDKLHILNYQDEVLAKHNMRHLTRHYFVSSPYLESNPGEQFYMFTIIAAWLINAAGRPFDERVEYGEPSATMSDILAELRAFGVRVDFPPSKLLSGSGEYVCFVLDRLAEEALKKRGFSFRSPKYAREDSEEPFAVEEDIELHVEEEVMEELDDDEEHALDLEALKLRSAHPEAKMSCVNTEILQSMVDAAEWYLEVERVLPQLKVTVKNDNKDWRIHVEQMHRHRDGISTSFKEAKGYLERLQEDIGKTLEKVRSREKYINNQLEHLIQEYRNAQAQLGQVKEQYRQASEGLTEKARILAEMDDELKRVKQETEERNSSVSDGAPLVNIKRCMATQKQEMVQLEKMIASQRLQMKKSNSLRDTHAAVFPEQTYFSHHSHTWTWDS